VWQPTGDYIGCFEHFKFKISAPNGHNYLQWAATPDHSAEKFKEGRMALKAVKTI
jgi:hypothetical protein